MPESNLQQIVQSVLQELGVSDPTPMPDPDYLMFYKNITDRIIYMDFDVDGNVLMLHKLIMRWNMQDEGVKPEDRKPIKLFIMSHGGSLDYMWMLIDTILTSKTPVWTYNIGMAHSAAGLIFMSGHRRFMAKNASIIIHEGSAEFDGDSVKVLDATDSYRKAIKKMKEFVLQHTEIPKNMLNRKRANDWELSAEDCLKYHVCDELM